MQQITISETNFIYLCIEIYPRDSAIQHSNNRGPRATKNLLITYERKGLFWGCDGINGTITIQKIPILLEIYIDYFYWFLEGLGVERISELFWRNENKIF